MQQYTQAAETLLDHNAFLGVAAYLIAGALLLILAANVVDAAKKLFAKKKPDSTLEQHCKDAEDRFKRGERHIAENHEHISDLREGQRVMCVAVMALLNHELHNGNADEMHKASTGLNDYLINRK